jgi:uncharacterized protein YecE (DUF72 family)
MKFGEVENSDAVDLTLPEDHISTSSVLLAQEPISSPTKVYTGFAKWNRNYITKFYPKGIGKKELEFYSTYINCIEMNAFFYRIFPTEMVKKWYQRSANNFTFCPKIPQVISQFRRLKDCEDKTNQFIESISHFKEKLGTCFLQMHPTFKPDKFQDLTSFIENWPKPYELSVELRHTDWYNDHSVSKDLYSLLQENNISNTITDTAGRRDLLHMRLTNDTCFIRFTGTNQPSDYIRLDEWIARLKSWESNGIKTIYFFVHQNDFHKSMDLYNYFITNLNQAIGCDLATTV